MDEAGKPRQLITVERADLFQKCFSACVQSFLHYMEETKVEKARGKSCGFVFRIWKSGCSFKGTSLFRFKLKKSLRVLRTGEKNMIGSKTFAIESTFD